MRELSDKLAITKLSHQLAITKTDIRNRSRHYRMIYYFAVRLSTFGHPDVVNPELFHIHSITSNMKIPSYQNEAQRDCPSISSALCSLWPNCNKCNITTWSAADCAIYLNDVIGPKHRYFGNVRWYSEIILSFEYGCWAPVMPIIGLINSLDTFGPALNAWHFAKYIYKQTALGQTWYYWKRSMFVFCWWANFDWVYSCKHQCQLNCLNDHK